MRLVELFIKETAEEDRAIISLAGPIYNLLQNYADQDLDFEDEGQESIIVGKIGDFFDTPFEGIDNITIEIQSDAALLRRAKREHPDTKDAPGGIWDANTKTLIFNSDYLSTGFMKSTIAHELRHMLDDIKSNFKVAASKKYSTPKDKRFRSGKSLPGEKHLSSASMSYLAQPAEINARFIQALNDLIPIIKRLSNLPNNQARAKLHRYLVGLMDKHQILDMFRDKDRSPDYKRLLKRGADFIDKELAHQQSKTKQITESVTFGIGKLVDYNGRKVWSDPFSKEEEVDCVACDGSGKEGHREYIHPDTGEKVPAKEWDCRFCGGSGKSKDWRTTAPEFNVANANARSIMDMLGIESEDLHGILEPKDLPDIRRRLIRLKNQDLSRHTVDPSKVQGKMHHYKDEQGMDRIGRQGPTIYDMGRSKEQVEHYIDSLLSLIDFAQKNDAAVTWG